MRLIRILAKPPLTAGFGRADLFAVLVAIGCIAFLTGPVFGRGSRSGRSAVCLSNMRTMIRAWQLYADDHAGKLVHNGLTSSETHPNVRPWVRNVMTWSTEADNTNRFRLFDPKWSALGPYLPGFSSVHKCTQDNYLSASQKQAGFQERVRSVSMNYTVGERSIDLYPESFYQKLTSLGGIRFPRPSELAVLMEEHPDSINDGALLPPPPMDPSFGDHPGNLHEGGMASAFADGSAVLHRWRGQIIAIPVRYQFQSLPPSAKDPDRDWLTYHSARVVSWK